MTHNKLIFSFIISLFILEEYNKIIIYILKYRNAKAEVPKYWKGVNLLKAALKDMALDGSSSR